MFMQLLPLLNLNPRAALGLVIPKAGGAATVEDPVAVHAFSMRELPIDKGGYEVIPHLGSESFLRLCAQEQWTRDAVSALFWFIYVIVGIANCIFHT
jgi:hypothetical protein